MQAVEKRFSACDFAIDCIFIRAFASIICYISTAKHKEEPWKTTTIRIYKKMLQ
jgi:hypothetical protein